MATLHEGSEGPVFYVKGAPEKILQQCSSLQGAEGTEAFDYKRWHEDAEMIASRGRRVLALAYLKDGAAADAVFDGPAALPKDLILLGLVGMIDPARQEAVEAVAECQGGGIRVTMITGDHATTAVSIAHEIGIGDGERVVEGVEVEAWDDAELAERCREVDVFARTSPEHKLRLVRAMQSSGQIVAMTGDGVNDAPALKQANVGVAMGIKGTEVSKEAARWSSRMIVSIL